MANQNDDCYYFFYSTCTKGDCPFRHCVEAIGNETVCNLWEEGRCFRKVCKFRHMKIDKIRSEIPCYWETQILGCQKVNCAFHHTKGRFIEGNFLPPKKTFLSGPEPAQEEVNAALPAHPLAKVPSPQHPSPQLRSVMKVDNESVPSPTHPPVVINAADDDEDDDGARLSIGIRSLRHVKSKKLTERGSQLGSVVPPVLCTAAVPLYSLPGTEKENIRSVVRTVTVSSCTGEEPLFRQCLAGRLEKRKPPFSSGDGMDPPLKRSLAERLGRKLRSPERVIEEAPQKVQVKSIKERLGFPAEQSRAETVNPLEAAVGIRIKTLEEIRLEKLSQRAEQDPQPKEDGILAAEDPSIKAPPSIRIKSFEEVLAEKKLRQMEEAERHRVESESSGPVQEAEEEPQDLPHEARGGSAKVQLKEVSEKRAMEQVRVKTLAEIRREKALRQQKGLQDTLNGPSQVEAITKGRRILLTGKPAAVKEEKLQVEQCVSAAPRPSAGGDAAQPCLDQRMSNSNSKVLVKSFEEIMREKRQRKQQEEAVQLLKAHAPLSLLESSPIEEAAAKESAPAAVVPQATAAKEPPRPSSTMRLLHVRPQRTSPVNSQQLSLDGFRGLSPLRSELPSPKKPQQSRLQGSSPVRPQQPPSPESPQQPPSPVKPQQPPCTVKPQQPSSPARPLQPSSPVKPLQPSSPVKPLQPSSPVKPQPLSLPVRTQLPSSQAKPQQSLSPIQPQQPSSPILSHQQPSSELSSSIQPEQPSQVETEQSSHVLPQELSPGRQQETLDTSAQDTLETCSPEADDPTVDDVPASLPAKKGKGKPKASVKPLVGKKRGPTKGPQKRKGSKSQPTAVAAVKPLSPDAEITAEEPPAKKAAPAADDASRTEEPPTTRACSEISKDSTAPPEAQPFPDTPAAEKGSPASSPASVKTRRASASALKSPLPLEDDLDKLMWELSGGRLGEEAEIDLDEGKDQDDLMLELDEMIDG